MHVHMYVRLVWCKATLDRYPFYYVAAVTLSHPCRDVFYNVFRLGIIEMFTIESN